MLTLSVVFGVMFSSVQDENIEQTITKAISDSNFFINLVCLFCLELSITLIIYFDQK